MVSFDSSINSVNKAKADLMSTEVGTVEGAKKAVTVGDLYKVMGPRPWVGRQLSRLWLRMTGHGNINQASAEALLRSNAGGKDDETKLATVLEKVGQVHEAVAQIKPEEGTTSGGKVRQFTRSTEGLTTFLGNLTQQFVPESTHVVDATIPEQVSLLLGAYQALTVATTSKLRQMKEVVDLTGKMEAFDITSILRAEGEFRKDFLEESPDLKDRITKAKDGKRSELETACSDAFQKFTLAVAKDHMVSSDLSSGLFKKVKEHFGDSLEMIRSKQMSHDLEQAGFGGDPIHMTEKEWHALQRALGGIAEEEG